MSSVDLTSFNGSPAFIFSEAVMWKNSKHHSLRMKIINIYLLKTINFQARPLLAFLPDCREYLKLKERLQVRVDF